MSSTVVEQKLSAMETGLKTFIDTHVNKAKELDLRMMQVEQAIVGRGPGSVGPAGFFGDKSIGEMICQSDGFAALQKGAPGTGKIAVGSFNKDITNGPPSAAQPLIAPYRMPGIIMPGLRPMTIRDLMPNLRTNSNLVQYSKETVFTNAAAPQAGEGVAKAQSDLTFELQSAPVQTLAHWMAASRQILDDAPALEDYLNARLTYGLKLVEEDQLLTGDGTGQNLSGLITNSTAYNRGTVAGDTDLDVIRRAKTQVRDSFFEADAVIVHPHDWERMELLKTSFGQYLVSVPKDGAPPQLWGMNVVATPAIPVGKFLCGAFRLAAAIWDRYDATIEISREHADFFTRNMVAILCEERLSLTVFRPLALVYGTLPQAGS